MEIIAHVEKIISRILKTIIPAGLVLFALGILL
jgi:hypothetical protein